MAKYMFRTSYTQSGLKGLLAEGGTGREGRRPCVRPSRARAALWKGSEAGGVVARHEVVDRREARSTGDQRFVLGLVVVVGQDAKRVGVVDEVLHVRASGQDARTSRDGLEGDPLPHLLPAQHVARDVAHLGKEGGPALEDHVVDVTGGHAMPGPQAGEQVAQELPHPRVQAVLGENVACRGSA